MIPRCDPVDVERFRDVVARRLGLQFEDSKLGQLAEVLGRRLDTVDDSPAGYLGRLQDRGASRSEIRALARELTVPETYFFRGIDQFRAFEELALPERLLARSAQRRLRILSAGCASGEEPFSLAILVRERVADPAWAVSIRAVDLNAAALGKARHGRYSAWALRETPDGVQRRWFRAAGRDFELDDAVRRAVTFEERNLVDDDPDLWPAGAYDVVFCRNVLMYFTTKSARALVSRIAAAMAPGGYLFLGHAETLRGLSQDFHLRHTHGTFYYQLRGEVERPSAGAPATLGAQREPEPLAPAVERRDTWIEVIRGASRRIAALARGSSGQPPPSAGARGVAHAPPAWDLGTAFELLKAERYIDALDRIRTLPPESAADPDVLLLRATLLTHGGRLVEAEGTCAELLAREEMSAGAHYLLALCREGLGDLEGARSHDQVAAYLDSGFAMPRLHLGLLARRAGERVTARRELSRALELLRTEEASRLLLFGGGFSRDALTALCRAELAACGGEA